MHNGASCGPLADDDAYVGSVMGCAVVAAIHWFLHCIGTQGVSLQMGPYACIYLYVCMCVTGGNEGDHARVGG